MARNKRYLVFFVLAFFVLAGILLVAFGNAQDGSDELFVTFFVVAMFATTAGLVAAIMAMAFKYQWQEMRALDKVYREVAQHYGGTASANTPLLYRASAQFVSHGAHITVDFRVQNGDFFVQCHIGYPDLQLRLEISPSFPLQSLGKYIGMQDIEIGDARFDADYIIGGNSQASICRLLNAQVRSSIDLLRKLFEEDEIMIEIRGGVLLIEKLIPRPHTFPAIVQFVDASLDLFREMQRINSVEIEFVTKKETVVPKAEGSLCQICGDEIHSDIVYCRGCRTPHHEDCWRYYGACSTYGCGETIFLRRRKSKRGSR